MRRDDGRLHAYGWCLPGRTTINTSIKGSFNQSASSVPVPVPIYCQPLAETSPGMKIWCAAGVNLMGGYTKDGGLMVNFYFNISIIKYMHESKKLSLLL